jgi:hypothetical protein
LPQSQPTSLAALNENLPTASAETEVLSAGETANGKIKAIEEEAAPAVSGADQSDKQQPSAEHTNSRRKLTPERMRIVIEALRECPLLEPAAAKAGIHRKTLEYWLKCSKAGRDGYDVDWEDFEWRFHEACEVAVEEAHQRLLDAMFSIAMGPPTHKVDDQRVMNFAERHTDAYARHANGNFIIEFPGPGNVKIHERLLELLRPELWGKAQKRKIVTRSGVLVVGERRPEKSWATSIKASQWKSASRMLEETKG